MLGQDFKISNDAKRTFEMISDYHHCGKIWSIGLTRLLDYITLRNNAKVSLSLEGETYRIRIRWDTKRKFRFLGEGLSVTLPYNNCSKAFFIHPFGIVQAELIADKINHRLIARWPIKYVTDFDWDKKSSI
jgi:hypothetical protein